MTAAHLELVIGARGDNSADPNPWYTTRVGMTVILAAIWR
jgi:hypothetical protein